MKFTKEQLEAALKVYNQYRREQIGCSVPWFYDVWLKKQFAALEKEDDTEGGKYRILDLHGKDELKIGDEFKHGSRWWRFPSEPFRTRCATAIYRRPVKWKCPVCGGGERIGPNLIENMYACTNCKTVFYGGE